MSIAKALARQLRRPSGIPGRAMAYVLNRANGPINRGAVERLSLVNSQRVLEIGFGGGAALARILGRTDGFVAGIEVSDAMLEHGRRRFRRQMQGGRLELRRGGVSEIPYEDESFDRVLTVQTIYFWPDPAAGLREIHRVLAPGGRVVIATATKEVMDRRSVTSHGFRKFEDGELEELLREAGFGAVTSERDGPRVFSEGEKPRAGDEHRSPASS